MYRATSWVALLAVVSVLALACSPSAPSVLTTPTSPVQATQPTSLSPTSNVPNSPPKPTPGLAAISGRLYSYVMARTIPETVFYLTKPLDLNGEPQLPAILGPRPEFGDVQSVSDSSGRFSLTNVPPGDYLLLVWAPYNWIVGETTAESRTPLTISLAANQAADLGTVFVPWP